MSNRTVDYSKTVSYSNHGDVITVTETFVEHRSTHRVVRTINGSPVVVQEDYEDPKVMVNEGSGGRRWRDFDAFFKMKILIVSENGQF